MRIAVIGGGYVGLVSGACLAENGHEVFIVEQDAHKVEQINAGISPIHEEGLDAILRSNVNKRLQATVQLDTAVQLSDLTIIAVGTPFDGDQIDLSQIEQASIAVGQALKDATRYHVVLVKSTVVPGTTDELVLPLLETHSGKRIGLDIGVSMNPEFLREGCAVSDFMQPDRIVIGGIDERTRLRASELYAPFGSTDKVLVNNRTAEMIKYASNSLFATLISFSNEMGNLCSSVDGVDVVNVLKGVQLDKRLSPLLENGERISPAANTYLAAGCGFGGSCFPKDVNALRAFGEQHNVDMPLLNAVMQTNATQPDKMLELLSKHLPSTQGKKITVLGLAFKPGTDDVRESPALPIIEQLHESGAHLSVFDPVAMPSCEAVLPSLPLHYAANFEQAIEGADAILLITSWPEFDVLPQRLAQLKHPPLVVDGRRIYDAQLITHYEGIGRGYHSVQELEHGLKGNRIKPGTAASGNATKSDGSDNDEASAA